jgi:hypothetical protein
LRRVVLYKDTGIIVVYTELRNKRERERIAREWASKEEEEKSEIEKITTKFSPIRMNEH